MFQYRSYQVSKRTSFTIVVLALFILPSCGQRSVTVRNALDRPIMVRLSHDAFLSGDRTLDQAQVAPYESETFGPFTEVPLLDPIDVEISLVRSMGDLPQKHRVDKKNVSLVVEPSVLESWTGFVIRRDDRRFK